LLNVINHIKQRDCCVKHFCVYLIQNCRGGCPHPPELRGDVGIAPYNKAASPQPLYKIILYLKVTQSGKKKQNALFRPCAFPPLAENFARAFNSFCFIGTKFPIKQENEFLYTIFVSCNSPCFIVHNQL